jgi:hypothetical protein
LVAFGGLLVAFTAAHDLKMLVSGYQPIDMHCIVSSVKFKGGLYISVLRNKQLFEKNGGQKFAFSKSSNFSIFQPRHLKKGRSGKTSHFFLDFIFLVNGTDNSFKFDINSEVLFIYCLIPRKLDFIGWLAAFDTTPVSRFLRAHIAFTVSYNIKVLVSRYQSIDMHYIVLLVKYNGGLSISVLRNRKFFKKNGSQKFAFSKS